MANTTQRKKAKLRKECDNLWYQAVIERWGTRCEVCGKSASLGHHFFTKSSYGHLRYDIDNGISLCMGCHFTLHNKQDTMITLKIIKKRGQNWLNSLEARAKIRPEGSYQTLKYYEETKINLLTLIKQ